LSDLRRGKGKPRLPHVPWGHRGPASLLSAAQAHT
jgi:hypothetical protein